MNIVPGPIASKTFRPLGYVIDDEFVSLIEEWAGPFVHVGAAIFFGEILEVQGFQYGNLACWKPVHQQLLSIFESKVGTCLSPATRLRIYHRIAI